jgi:hypothetical protein
MTKILVVTAGAYSDYHIVAVFDEEHRAEAEYWADRGDRGGIEEYELNALAEPARRGLRLFHVLITKNATGMDSSHDPRECDSESFTDDPASTLNVDCDSYGRQYISGTVWATNKQHAPKNAMEHLTQAIALGTVDQKGDA